MKTGKEIKIFVEKVGGVGKWVVLSVIVLIIALAVILGWMDYNDTKKSIIAQQQNELLSNARTAAEGIETYFKQIGTDLYTFSGLGIHRRRDKNASLKALIRDFKGNDYKEEVKKKGIESSYRMVWYGILTEKGIRVLYVTDEQQSIPRFEEDYLNSEDEIKNQIFNNPRTTGKLFISELDTFEDEFRIWISFPIIAGRSFSGVVVMGIDPSDVYDRFVMPIKSEESRYAWVIDDDGIILSYPRTELIGKNIIQAIKEKEISPTYLEELQDTVKKMTGGEEGVGIYYSPWTEKKEIVAFTPVHVGNEMWSIGVSIDYSYTAVPINKHMKNIFGIMAVILLFFTGMGTYITRTRRETAVLKTEANYLKQLADSAESLRKSEEKLARSQKMEAIAILAGGIAHQFNNALSPLSISLDMLEMDYPGDEKIADYSKQMKDSTHRIAQLTSQLLAYARGGKYQAKILPAQDLIKETLPLIRHTIDPAIQIDTDVSHDIFNINADIIQMQMMLSAILTNASEATEGKGSIRIICRNETIMDKTITDFPDIKPGDYIRLMIEDFGQGMDEETRSRVFEPFFTTKFQGRGLGLAAAYGIVKNHGGWISVDSELGKGTAVHIYLPAVETPVKEPEKPKIDPVPIKGTATILVIEDEKMVMDSTRMLLEKLGYSVLEAKTGKEAINIVKTFDGDIDLALLDILLPDMSGNTIYPRIMEARPNLKVIVFSGYSIDGPAQEILDAGAQGFIQKPISIEDFSIAIREVLDKA